jgi:hypothetical protein
MWPRFLEHLEHFEESPSFYSPFIFLDPDEVAQVAPARPPPGETTKPTFFSADLAYVFTSSRSPDGIELTCQVGLPRTALYKTA